MNRCIAGWPMNPCGVITATPPICAIHRAAAKRAWDALSDNERAALAASLPRHPRGMSDAPSAARNAHDGKGNEPTATLTIQMLDAAFKEMWERPPIVHGSREDPHLLPPRGRGLVRRLWQSDRLSTYLEAQQ